MDTFKRFLSYIGDHWKIRSHWIYDVWPPPPLSLKSKENPYNHENLDQARALRDFCMTPYSKKNSVRTTSQLAIDDQIDFLNCEGNVSPRLQMRVWIVNFSFTRHSTSIKQKWKFHTEIFIEQTNEIRYLLPFEVF